MIHSIIHNIAEKYNVEASIFLKYMYFRVNYNEGENLCKNKYWIECNLDHFQKIFTYFKRSEIINIINYCVTNDLILIRDHEDKMFKYYTLSDKAMHLINEGL